MTKHKGRFETRMYANGNRRAKIFDFAVNSSELASNHLMYLGGEPVPFLLRHPQNTILLFGTASGTGSEKHNLKLSQRRAKAVGDFLRLKGVKDEQFGGMFQLGYGEAFAADNVEDEHQRAVHIFLYDRGCLEEILEEIHRNNLEWARQFREQARIEAAAARRLEAILQQQQRPHTGVETHAPDRGIRPFR